jgi:hypothetical protein
MMNLIMKKKHLFAMIKRWSKKSTPGSCHRECIGAWTERLLLIKASITALREKEIQLGLLTSIKSKLN